ncbi:hypothetical protein D9M68_832850 [compost metagenome]
MQRQVARAAAGRDGRATKQGQLAVGERERIDAVGAQVGGEQALARAVEQHHVRMWRFLPLGVEA